MDAATTPTTTGRSESTADVCRKISIDAGFTCPNRDGSQGVGGCSFCNNDGFTPSYLREQRNILDQIETGLAFMRRRYPDTIGFLAYFQSYSNTYDDLDA
jgi:radical SAM superfamily enzyme